jgi:hypothetical protein
MSFSWSTYRQWRHLFFISLMARKWHFIIPFFYGKNRYVTRRGGAPVDKKLDYLSRTVMSIRALRSDADIAISTQDAMSTEKAALVVPGVVRIEVPAAPQLPYRSLIAWQRDRVTHFAPDDIVAFTEDDQILGIDRTVVDDILDNKDDIIFSPHRWSRLFLFLRIRHRPLYRHLHRWGVLENVNRKNPPAATHRFRHVYATQPNKFDAYAAYWFMRASTFLKIPISETPPGINLESSSFAVFESGFPVLKLSLADGENPGSFIADHLSGYDYNRRIF